MNITHRAFFGDGDHAFALTDPMVKELERIAGLGIGALYERFADMRFAVADVLEIIRLGLIGAGLDPKRAQELTATYGHNRPLGEIVPLAAAILDARWHGKTEEAGQ